MKSFSSILDRAYGPSRSKDGLLEGDAPKLEFDSFDRLKSALGGKPKAVFKITDPSFKKDQSYDWKFGPTTVRLSRWNDGTININHVKTEESKRNKGYARKALKKITSIADNEQIPLSLSIEPGTAVNVTGLIKFYQSLGFLQKHPESAFMVRIPIKQIHLTEAMLQSKDLDLDKTYDTFKTSYEKQTGKAWDKGKFLDRIHGWTLWGDPDGFVATRQQASGPVKLVGAAGNMAGVKKGFQEVLGAGKPVWGAMDLRLATLSARMGMRMPPAWMMKKILNSIKDRLAVANGVQPNDITVNDDGSMTVDYPDVGKATKYVVGNKAYFDWMLKAQASRIPAVLRTAISYFLHTGKPPPQPAEDDSSEVV